MIHTQIQTITTLQMMVKRVRMMTQIILHILRDYQINNTDRHIMIEIIYVYDDDADYQMIIKIFSVDCERCLASVKQYER